MLYCNVFSFYGFLHFQDSQYEEGHEFSIVLKFLYCYKYFNMLVAF